MLSWISICQPTVGVTFELQAEISGLLLFGIVRAGSEFGDMLI